MAVGPSQAPMTAMATASSFSKPKPSASSSVRKMPNWPAAPSMMILGLENSGPKSVMAPMPRKISTGKISVRMPMS